MLKRLLSLVLAALIAVPAPVLPAQAAPPSIERPVAHAAGDAAPALPRLAQRLGDTIPPLYMLGGDDKIAPVASFNAATDPFPSAILSHSRTSLATLSDSTGKLTYAPNNLLTYSNTFSNAAWIKLSSSITTGQSDPFGGTNASKLVETATTAQHYVAQNNGLGTFSGGGIYTVYAKAAERTKLFLWNDWTGHGVKFDLSNGNTITSISATGGSTSLGNGWYQLWVKFPDEGTGNYSVSISSLDAAGSTSYTGDGTSGLYIYQATGSRVTYETTPRTADQVITTSAAYYGPRIDYDPNTLAVKGLLIEEARTNAISASNDLSSVAWAKNGTTVTINSATGPDGQTSLAQVNKTTSFNGQLYRNYSTANTKTVSFYASKGSLNYVAVSMHSSIGSAFFNLNTGAVAATNNGTATVTASIVAVGGGIYRCIAVFSGTYTPAELHIEPSDGTNTTQLSPWGSGGTGTINLGFIQVEEGVSFATSYIPTVAASVTRAADVVQFTGAALTALQGSAGTTIVQTSDAANSGSSQALIGSNAVSNMYMRYVGTAVSSLASDGTALAASGTVSLTSASRSAIAWGASSRSLVHDGGTVATDAKTFSGVSAAYLGAANGGAQYWFNGHFASFAIYNQRLPDATLQAKSVVGASYAANDNVNPFAPQFAANDNLPVHWRIAL